MPVLNPAALSVLVLVSLGLALTGLTGIALTARSQQRVRRRSAQLLANGDASQIVTVLDELRQRTDRLGQELDELRARTSRRVRSAVVTRYDAFDDTSGGLSYTVALLDDHGDGVVLSGINSRSQTRAYAKEISGGTSAQQLSDDERDAVTRALGSPAAGLPSASPAGS